MCRATLKGFAPHIHVLYREVPHILCITQLPANCASLEDVASTGCRCPGLVSGQTLISLLPIHSRKFPQNRIRVFSISSFFQQAFRI